MNGLSISSRNNPRIKHAAALRERRERRKRGEALVDGAREIVRALEAGVRPVEAFVCRGLARTEAARQAAALLGSGPAPLHEVTPEVFERLAFGNRGDGVVLVVAAPARLLTELTLPAAPVIALLVGLEKPGNVGAILRSADGAGVDAVIVVGGADLMNPNAIRASVGAVFKPNVCDATEPEADRWLTSLGLPIYSTRPEASLPYHEVDFRRGAALLFGSEDAGLGDAWRGVGVTPIRLPMQGVADSLNVAASAAVLFYEALRQRTL
ncbi:23S rRNA (uridine(2479)-2'-O)-methyltransferase [Pirellulimonas nuda]|uniref:23S rRNA (Uridine(2479)-2'-O)-methyltransferase n=1 Tax=Pirellulimonas nuda TaxID=2528009 RepID=A0A518DH90_9BACT|nr:RNA methyltransferase [Pirellulimonas nuda]QDU90836.1 23S rRNA (uridine(2479)-2'-O)-methyltransferase [Pirellulimonas nuda]